MDEDEGEEHSKEEKFLLKSLVLTLLPLSTSNEETKVTKLGCRSRDILPDHHVRILFSS